MGSGDRCGDGDGDGGIEGARVGKGNNVEGVLCWSKTLWWFLCFDDRIKYVFGGFLSSFAVDCVGWVWFT